MLSAAPKVAAWLQETLTRTFPDARIVVEDTTGTDDHFQVLIASAVFAGENTVKRHRRVYAALGDAMRERVHALSIKAVTPDEVGS